MPAADSEASKGTKPSLRPLILASKKLVPDTLIVNLAQETVEISVTEMVQSGFLVTGCGPIQQDAAAYVLMGLVLASLSPCW